MSETSYLIYKLASLLFALLIIYWGYRLLVIGFFNKAENASSSVNNKSSFQKAAPGVFFSLIGTFIFFFIIYKGVDNTSISSLPLPAVKSSEPTFKELNEEEGLVSMKDYSADTLFQRATNCFNQQKLSASVKYYNGFIAKAETEKVDENKLATAKVNVEKAKSLLQSNFSEMKILQSSIERRNLQLKKTPAEETELKKEMARMDSLKTIAKLYSSQE